MELIYLWIEKYKNIENQGFNFSSKNLYEYNYVKIFPNNKNYIKNFFGDNINITAIVGENGSGKSNIFEAILSTLMYNEMPIDKNYKATLFFYNSEDKKIYFKDFKRSTFLSLEEKNYSLDYRNFLNTKTFTFYYNYGLDWFYNDEQNIDFNKIYHKTDDYETPILLQPNKRKNQIHLGNIDYLAIRDMLTFIIHKNISFDFIDDFFTPTKFKIEIKLENVAKSDSNFIYEKIWSYYENRSIKYYERLICISRAYILRKSCFQENKEFIKDEELKKELTKENFDDMIEYISNKTFEDLYDENDTYKTFKIKQTFLFIEYLEKNKKFENDKIFLSKNISDNKDLILNLAPWIEIELFNKNDVSFYSLSYGQKFLIKFIYSLLNQLNNISKKKKYENIVLLLDEIEMGLHPNWQKKYLSILIKVLSKKIEGFNFKYNIICATHSPFILSDIPTQNCIFLKDGKQQNPFENSNTFGANIHTLLSHGFFMEDGLMGEFAKSKINEIKEFYEKVKKEENRENFANEFNEKKQKFKNIHSIIGEPFLKTIIGNYLDELDDIFLSNDDKKAKIDEEIKRLEELKGSL